MTVRALLRAMEAIVRPERDQGDQELISLALETKRVAESIADTAIRVRLIKIADALLDLAAASSGRC